MYGDRQCVCAVQELIRSGADDVKSKALQTAGNLAFCRENRSLLLQAEGFKEVMVRMADQGAVVKHEVRMSAIRALAILGELSLMTAVLIWDQSVLVMADQGAVVKHEVRMSANRALAILGELHVIFYARTSDVQNDRLRPCRECVHERYYFLAILGVLHFPDLRASDVWNGRSRHCRVVQLPIYLNTARVTLSP